MSRTAHIIRTRGKKGHRGLLTLCEQKGVDKVDIGTALKVGKQHTERIFQNPWRLNAWQMVCVAGMLSISPEYLLYVIRTNDHKTENPRQSTAELEDFKIRFPV